MALDTTFNMTFIITFEDYYGDECQSCHCNNGKIVELGSYILLGDC